VDAGDGSSPPAGFRAADHVQAGPWAAGGEDRARVAFAPEVAWWAAGSLAGAVTNGTREDGWVEVSVPMADEGALAGTILQFGPQARALEPASLCDEIVRRLKASARA
jgi:predicted DNA-binding transcriptional regulator YafY